MYKIDETNEVVCFTVPIFIIGILFTALWPLFGTLIRLWTFPSPPRFETNDIASTYTASRIGRSGGIRAYWDLLKHVKRAEVSAKSSN